MKEQIHSLTSLRGIAAWWVVIYHFREHVWAGGSMGFELAGFGYLAVDLFFIMSGFVIQMNYGDWFARGVSGKTLRDFVVLRLARIYPLHLVMSLIYLVNPLMIWLFSAAASSGDRYDPLHYVVSLFLVHGWGFMGAHGWNVPSWSISVEFAAYLVFPVFSVLVLHRLAGLGAKLLAGLALLALIALVFGANNEPSIGAAIPSLGVWRCVIEFSLGVVAFEIYREIRAGGYEKLGAGIAGVALAGLAGVAAAGLCPDYVFAPAMFLAAVISLACHRGVVSRLLETRWLVWLGEISYSTYLCHYFVKDWVKFLFVEAEVRSWLVFATYLVLILGFSSLLYRFVEMPGRRFVRAHAGLATPQKVSPR